MIDSTSGPSATLYPIPRNNSSKSSLTRVKGCTDPTGKRLPGKEISISSASKRSFKAFLLNKLSFLQ